VENTDKLYFDEINDYHFGQLSPEERLRFEANLIINPELSQAYEEFKKTVVIIKTQHIQNLKNNFQLLDSELDKELLKPDKPFARFTKYTFIVLPIGLLAVVLFFYVIQRKVDKPISAYYVREIGLPVVMGVGDTKFDNAMSAYKLNDFTGSEKILTNIFAKKPIDTVAYFIGVDEFELGKYSSAINYFLKVNNRSVFYDKSQYRLGLSYWQIGEIGNARQVFLKLKSTNSPFSFQAEIILKKLE